MYKVLLKSFMDGVYMDAMIPIVIIMRKATLLGSGWYLSNFLAVAF